VSAKYRYKLLAKQKYFRLAVWHLQTGLRLRTLDGHTDEINDVAISEDGRRAVSASRDKTLRVWDLTTGSNLCTLTHTNAITHVAMSADGRRAVTASKRTLTVWDLVKGRELRTLGYHYWATYWDTDLEEGRITGRYWIPGTLAMSRDGLRAVSGYKNNLAVWDLESGSKRFTMIGHSAEIKGVAFSGDGQRAVSASGDHMLKVWDVDTGELEATFTCDAPLTCCAFAGRSRIVAGDDSGRIHFISLELEAEPERQSQNLLTRTHEFFCSLAELALFAIRR
jgi:WD40 repeat protein